MSYAGEQGFDANVSLRLVDGYQWAAGIFQGYVPANEFLNLSAGYRINNNVRIHAHRHQSPGSEAVPAVRGIGDRAAGPGRDHGELLAILSP